MRFIDSYFFLSAIILALAHSAQAQICDFGPASDKNYLEENWLDQVHLYAEFSFEPEAGKIFGDLSLHLRVPGQIQDTLWLHGPGIEVEQSFLNGEKVQIYRVGKRIAIPQTELLLKDADNVLRLIYHAQPRKGLYFIGWNDSTNRAPKQIWSQGQGIDNRHWIPHWDHLSDKLTSEVKVIFDEGYSVISNGVLISKKTLENGKVQWHYRLEEPHSSYLIMLGIGQLEVVKEKVDGIDLEFYYSDYQQIEPGLYLDDLIEMIKYLNDRIGSPYPWSTFRIIPVRDYMHGAMENTTSVIMSDRLVRPGMFKNFSWVSAHEYAHQWFGDLITGTTNHDHWLHESFATYYHMEWLRFRFGESYYREIREQYRSSIFLANERDSIPVAKERSGSERQYYKGGWVLDMFEDMIGQIQFDELMKDYLKRYAFQNITTESFLGFIHDRYSGKYDLFWQRWICEAGEIAVEANTSDYGVQVDVSNSINGEYYPEQPYLEFYLANNSSFKVIRKLSSDWDYPMEIKIPVGSVGWAIDPEGKVLAYVQENKTLDEFRLDMEQDHFQHLRLRSLNSMLNFHDEGIWHELMNSILRTETNEEFIRAILSVEELVVDDHVICDLLNHQDSEIRILSLRKMRASSSLSCFDSLPVLFEKADGQEKLAIAQVGLQLDPQRFIILIGKTPWQVFESELDQIDWLVLKYLIEQDPRYHMKLLDFASESFSFDVRLKALRQLNILNDASSEYLKSIVLASVYFNRKLSSPAREILKSYYLQEEFQSQIDTIVHLSGLSEVERKTMNALIKRWKL
jgi:hypothetical protein